jgi:hypothetical protein
MGRSTRRKALLELVSQFPQDPWLQMRRGRVAPAAAAAE